MPAGRRDIDHQPGAEDPAVLRHAGRHAARPAGAALARPPAPEPVFPAARNRLIRADCLDVLRALPSCAFDLIYIDPPFFTGRSHSGRDGLPQPGSFADPRAGGLAGYLSWLGPRLAEMHRVLKRSGSLMVHLDWHAVHYVKCELDGIFGYGNFVNEIIWQYKTGGTSKRRLGRKHDTILFYAKSPCYKFNPVEEKSYLKHRYGFANVRIERDEGGYYTRVGLRDVWDLPALRGNQPETTGYPTQKPRALLDRIVALVTDPGDVVADFFCGSGTTLLAAQAAGRTWLGCDISEAAVALCARRLGDAAGPAGMPGTGRGFTVERWGG
ncbi:MAG: DNA-methyltransferase [Patescibacteria group bacterium]